MNRQRVLGAMSTYAVALALSTGCGAADDPDDTLSALRKGKPSHLPADAGAPADPKPLMDASAPPPQRPDAQPNPAPMDAGPKPGPECKAANQIKNGLFAYYRFDESSGQVAADAFGNNGQIAAPALWVPGRIGNALSFAGNNAVTVPSNSSINQPALTGAISVSTWVKLENSAGTQTLVARNEAGTSFQHFALAVDNGVPTFTIHFIRLLGTKALAPGKWSHVGASYDGITSRLYVDGVAAGLLDIGWPLSADSTPLTLGAQAAAGGVLSNRLSGVLDEVSLYDRALSEDEFQQLASVCGKEPLPPPPPPPPGNVIAHYDFNDGAGNVINDDFGNDAQLTGRAVWGKGTLAFDGKSIATAPANQALNSTGDTGAVSIAAWLKVKDRAVTGTIANRSEAGTKFEHFGLSLEAGHPVFRVHFFKVASAVPLLTNAWMHVAATYDGITSRLYVNGVEQGALDVGWPISADNTPLTIGGELNVGQPGQFLAAELNDLTIYNQPLQPAEISALAKTSP
ncbi:MAG: LamG domain-containing protein [Deltaproteobacteria bacterium]|nr:LamG domain-containing protein [Deltaproteobacteria bacterium]